MDEDNNLLPRENGDTANPTETERSRRLHLKRLGVIICFVLIFMDGGSPRADQRLHREEKVSDQSSRSQSLYTSKLNEVIKSKRNLNSPMLFARNITGVFHGNWDMNTGTANVSKSKREKTFLMQLRSVKLNNVPDLDFVYGVAKIYKAGVSESDLFYPLQGACSLCMCVAYVLVCNKTVWPPYSNLTLMPVLSQAFSLLLRERYTCCRVCQPQKCCSCSCPRALIPNGALCPRLTFRIPLMARGQRGLH